MYLHKNLVEVLTGTSILLVLVSLYWLLLSV